MSSKPQASEFLSTKVMITTLSILSYKVSTGRYQHLHFKDFVDTIRNTEASCGTIIPILIYIYTVYIAFIAQKT